MQGLYATIGNRRDPDGLTEIGLPHSSEETGESRRSKVDSKESYPEEKAFRHRRPEQMEQKPERIRAQPAKHPEVQKLMHMSFLLLIQVLRMQQKIITVHKER